MSAAHRLLPTAVPEDPVGQVLVLHGGAARRGRMRVSPAQLSVLRMVPIARRLARAGGGRLAVFRLLNSVRGWDTGHTPVADVEWALERLRVRLGDLPTSLVGHSLGGRAALLAGDLRGVRSMVALAPWVYPTEGRRDLGGRQVLIVHGSQDRVASPERAMAVAKDLARTARVGYISVDGGRHSMVRHHHKFDAYAADFVRATLLGEPVGGPVGAVLAGASWVET